MLRPDMSDLAPSPADPDAPFGADLGPMIQGPYAPVLEESTLDDLEVVGEIPRDLSGVYLRNGPNPRLRPNGRYHWFDGDGMLHGAHFDRGRLVYRNRWIRTEGLRREEEAGRALYWGVLETQRDQGERRERPMKDTANTDIIGHRGLAVASWYLCGDAVQVHPITLETLGPLEATRGMHGGFSAHPKVDDHTGELLFFNYGKDAPYMHYGVVDEHNDLAHYIDVPLPGPRMPHDMAFTENYAILNDLPMFWDPELLKHDIHLPKLHADTPARFAVIPRRGQTSDITWFEADPTYVLHFANAYEDGDEIVLDGFYQGDPEPGGEGITDKWQKAFRYLALDHLQTRLHRWRFNMVTGAVREEQLTDTISEFGMINGSVTARPHRYVYAASGVDGWFLFNGVVKHDLRTGAEESFFLGDGVYGSETSMAPRVGSSGEDDGYLITITTDMNDDASYCVVLDAARVSDGPVCKLRLPERVSSGTHSTWAAGSELRRWHETDTAAAAVGL